MNDHKHRQNNIKTDKINEKCNQGYKGHHTALFKL